MTSIDYAVGAVAILGHVALAVISFNRLHSIDLECTRLKVISKVFELILAVVFLALFGWLLFGRLPLAQWTQFAWGWPALVYMGICCLFAAVGVPRVVLERLSARVVPLLSSNHTTVVDLPERLGHRPVGRLWTRLWSHVPQNQILSLHVHEKELYHPGLPPALDGLTISHVSDLHFTGHLTRPFFEQVVELSNGFDADIVAVTGDIIDKAVCLDWIDGLLSRLRARHRGFAILGNHDRRLKDEAEIRRRLAAAGLINLGGQVDRLEVHGETILLAGNELPWFGPAPSPEAIEAAAAGAGFRILLSHSPDQIRWARRHRFDLMLAGHTHGGQVQFPVIGPLIAPSHYGTRYASGVFHEPPTLMHVSRGISGLKDYRFNCPPELTKLTLRSG